MCLPSSGIYFSIGIIFVLEMQLLYLRRNPEEKVEVDLHLIVLADRDGAHVVLVAQLRRRRF